MITSTLTFLFIISILVFVHELGHYTAAIWAKVKVEEFGIGFGKKLFAKKWKGTLFRLNLIPLGGYVQLHGEDGKTKAKNSFSMAPLHKRMVITLAGVFMNFIFAVVCLSVMFSVGTRPLLLSQQDVQRAISDGYIQEVVAEEGKHYKLVKPVQKPFPESVAFSFTESMRVMTTMATKIAQIPANVAKTGSFPDELMGPVGIVQITHKVTEQGIGRLVELMVMLSLSLALINMFPIPALDGGRFLLQLVEMVIRRRIPPTWEGNIHMMGFFLLIGLMIWVTWNDIMRIL